MGCDHYSVDVQDACKMLSNWKRTSLEKEAQYNDVIKSTQRSENQGNNSVDSYKNQCYRCSKVGHNAWQKMCSDLRQQTTNVMGIYI